MIPLLILATFVFVEVRFKSPPFNCVKFNCWIVALLTLRTSIFACPMYGSTKAKSVVNPRLMNAKFTTLEKVNDALPDVPKPTETLIWLAPIEVIVATPRAPG